MAQTFIYKILLVEDSEIFKDLVCLTLGSSYEIIQAEDLEKALKMLGEHQFDLILLDICFPKGDGFHFFSTILNNNDEYKQIPLIFLTANSDISSKVLGFSLGAEDYIVKPFEPAEFKARVEMRVKKYHARQNEGQILRKGGLEINLNAQRAFLILDQKKIDLQLTPLEFKLLSMLSTHEDQVFSRNQIFDKIWGADTYLTDRSVDTHIYSLRKKLRDCATYIQTVYGEGYRFSLN